MQYGLICESIALTERGIRLGTINDNEFIGQVAKPHGDCDHYCLLYVRH